MRFGGSASPKGIRRAAHPLAAFGHGLIREPDNGEAGEPGPDLDCTSTARASIPSKANVVTRANIPEPRPTPLVKGNLSCAILFSVKARSCRRSKSEWV